MKNIRTYSELSKLKTFKERYNYLKLDNIVREIYGTILVHHINPITKDDIINNKDFILNPEYLISTSKLTHDAIHYSDDSILDMDPIIRLPNDMCPWK